MTLFGSRSRRIPDDPAGGVGTDTEGGQVAAISCGVVATLPALAYVGRVSGEQDGCFEFAGVHVVGADVVPCHHRARFRTHLVSPTHTYAMPTAADVLVSWPCGSSQTHQPSPGEPTYERWSMKR